MSTFKLSSFWGSLQWDNDKPKKEEKLSSFIGQSLKDDLEKSGVIALREVEIRPARENKLGNLGENIDLYVAGLIPSKNEIVKLYIEVKGDWNSGVKTSMKDQLLDRYLKDNECNHGIYLIGWYNCAQRDKTHNRNKTGNRMIKTAIKKYDEQAEELSKNGKKIKAFVLNCALRG